MPALTNVSVNLDEIPSSAWPIDATAIADTDLATLARAMATVVLDGYGAVIAYPDAAAGTTRVRLEWQLDRARPYWWRLGVILAGTPGQPPTITAYLGVGDSQRATRPVTARPTEVAAIRREFARVVEATAARLRGEGNAAQRPLFYVELPPPWWIAADTTLPSHSALLRRSAVVRPNEARVAAVGIEIRESGSVSARDAAMGVIAEVAAMMTLVAGRAVTAWGRLPNGFRHPMTLRASRSSPFPPRFFKEEMSDMRRDLGAPLTVLASVVPKLAPADREVWMRMLLAYAAAADLVRLHPTIAAVTYLAALGAGLRDEQCGKATCPEHGNVVQHGVRGERRMIADRLVDRGVVNPAERHELEQLLRRVYAGQRSAFVHDAELAHTERGDPRLVALPTDTDVVSPQWHRRDDLERVAALTRALVFAELAARTGVKLIGPPLRVSVRDRTGIEGSARSKPNTRLAMKVHAGRSMYAVAEPGMPLHIGLRDVVGAPTTATDPSVGPPAT
jgi:hypothetical protein